MSEPSPPITAPAKPSVLMVGRLYPPARGSGGRLLRELARSFARDGWDVRVLTTDVVAGDDPDGAVQVKRLRHQFDEPGVWGGFILLIRLFFAMLWLPRPAIVVTMSDPPLLVVVGHLMARLRGIAHFHWCHDVYPDLLPVIGVRVPRWGQAVMMRLSRWAMNGATRIVVIGRCMARHLAQTGVDAHHITLIPNWPELAMNPHVKTGNVSVAPVDAALLSGSTPSILGPVPKFRVLYIGTVGYAHPVDTILDAATILESLHPEIEFIFIGDVRAQAQINLEKARRSLGNVRVLPFQPQSRLRDIMESGDIHLVSMKQDAAGLMVPAKFYAALSAARPCILVGPEACEIARVINDYKVGAVVPQKAAQMLAQTIIDYRFREDLWFTAHDGAIKAAAAYTAEDMIRLWLKKAREVVAA